MNTLNVTEMPVIGTLVTKELTAIDGKGNKVVIPAEQFDVVQIIKASYGVVYVTNKWYKEYRKIPQLVPAIMVKVFKRS